MQGKTDTLRRLTDYYQILSMNGIQWTLGFGAYGSVLLARCKISKKTVAIKKILRKMATGQVNIHLSLNHPNIIKIIDYFYDEPALTTYLVLEYASKGTLYQLIRQHGIKDTKIIKSIFRSVCQAVNYMHSKGIMHRDIKPQNILLDEQYNVKLCDFGFARKMQARMTLCGTAEYMSPEMILRKSHDHKVDVWGIGILLFELIEGHAPFEGRTQDEILEKMEQPLYFSQRFTDEEIQLVHIILKVNPRERPEIHQLLMHPWLTGKNRSEETSKRSTMDQQKQSRIKILKIRQLPLEFNRTKVTSRAFKSSSENQQFYFESFTSGNQSMFKPDKVSLKRNYRKS